MGRDQYDVEDEIKQGQLYKWSGTLTDDGVIRDLTGWTAQFEVRNDRGEYQVFQVDLSNGITLGSEEWNLDIMVSGSLTALLKSPDGCREWNVVGELRLYDPTGEEDLRLDFLLNAIGDIES